MALALIIRVLLAHGPGLGALPIPVQRAVDSLLKIRPECRPNELVLRVGLKQFLPPSTAHHLAVNLVNHPLLIENRFMNPRSCEEEELRWWMTV
jgi:hypothetical protein